MRRRQFILKSSTAAAAVATPVTATATTESRTRVLIVVGPSNHPPGTHEVAAGGRLMKHCLESSTNVADITVDLVNQWPEDANVLAATSTVVFIGDTFPLQRMPNTPASLSQLGTMMNRGCGIVCIHYATGLRGDDVAEDGDHPLLHWMGGYFATRCKHHQSIAKIFPSATITSSAPQHAVWNGCKEFTLNDEPYINNYFGSTARPPAGDVTSLAISMLPPESPQRETVSWCIERPDGGRGMGVVMPHYYRNWKNEDLRRFILNGVAWTAKREIPEEGLKSDLPDLAMFKPDSVEPQPRRRKQASSK